MPQYGQRARDAISNASDDVPSSRTILKPLSEFHFSAPVAEWGKIANNPVVSLIGAGWIVLLNTLPRCPLCKCVSRNLRVLMNCANVCVNSALRGLPAVTVGLSSLKRPLPCQGSVASGLRKIAMLLVGVALAAGLYPVGLRDQVVCRPFEQQVTVCRYSFLVHSSLLRWR